MELDRSLLKEFAQITNDAQEDSKAKQYVRGTVTSGGDDRKYVTIDGSDMVTPISEVVDVELGDRVLVSIENHKATIIGNFTFPPSARKEQEALDNSNTAISDSNTALEKAQSASDKADTAITESSVASALAGEAKSEASEAVIVAQNASQNATEAKAKAEEANTKSAAAQTAANESKDAVSATNIELSKVKTEVANAKNDISSALSDLESQAGEIANIKETYSTKVETNKVKADLTTEITKKVGELQTTVSENYALKTDVVEMEGSLQTQITQNAENISSQASKVEKLEADTAAAQESVDKALADALAAQNAANAAQSTADAAQSAANTAKADAATAQTKADNAQAAADAAQAAVDVADKSLQQAKNDLAEAKQNLANVTSRVDATEQEIADAQTKVNEATTNVNKALEDVAEAQLAADNAQTAADKAQADANTAKTAANKAQTAADNAQTAADNAQTAADKAQADVAALTNRVTTAETKISQNAEAIELRATKTEVTKSVNDINTNLSNNYYNKTQADAAIKVASDNINLSVSKTYATITDNQKAQAAANKAQSTANTAVNNAKTAQDTADDAKAKAESAKTDLSALTTRVTEAESSISQNANKITAAVTEVTTVKKSAVTSSVEQFYLSTSPTSLSGGSWSTTQPTWSEGKYIWRRTLVTKGDGSTSYSPSENGVCITGNTGATGERGPQGVKGDTGSQGPQGVKGDTGAAGKGIKSTAITYQAWPNGTSTPTGTWSSSPPATSASNPYLWTRTVITYTDNSTSTSYSVGSTPEGIVIGGRNLLVGSESGIISNQLLDGSTALKWRDTTLDGNPCYYMSGTRYIKINFPTLKVGEQYIFSCDVARQSGGTSEDVFISIGESTAKVGIASAGIWTNFNVTFTASDASTYALVRVNNVSSSGSNEWVGHTRHFKLEKGNKATDWTPAPEDVEEGYKNYTDDAVGDATVTITESYQSLIEETSKQINLMIQKLNEITNSQGTSISTISNQLQLTTEMAQFVKTTTEKLQDVVDGKVSAEEIQEWARFDGATLELGASNQPFKAKLSTTELAFYQGNNKVAWISNNELHILTAIITKSIGCGNFTFIDEGDLGFSLL